MSNSEATEKLRLFHQKAVELSERRLLKTGFTPTLSVSFERMSGTRMSIWQPDEEDFRSFLMDLRQFVSPGDPIFLDHIYNLCQDYITNEQLRGRLVKAREAWRLTQRDAGIKLVVDGKEISPTWVINLWLYGDYLHSDLKKRAELQRLLDREPVYLRHMFLDQVAQATNVILHTAHIINVAFKEGAVKGLI